MKKWYLALFLVPLVLLGVAGVSLAETQNVKVSGSIDVYSFYRTNFDLLDNNDASVIPVGGNVPGQSHSGSTGSRSESENYFNTITQIEVSADLTDKVSTVINLINQRDWNAAPMALDDSNDPFLDTSNQANNEFDIELDLAYVQMKEIFYAPLTLTIGRQDLLFGRGFIIGWNPQDPQGLTQADEFTQIQSFDAIRATLDFSPWTLDLVYSKIRENATNSEDDRDLYISYLTYKFAEYNAVADLYWVGEFDRSSLSDTTGTKDNETETVGGRVQFDPISQVTLGAEVAYQFGDFRAAIGDPKRDRDAWGADLFGEYRWDNAWKPTLGLEYVYLSGEGDLSATSSDYGAWNDNYRGPTYGWIHEYLETYYATADPSDQPNGQNMEHVSVTGSIMPMSDLKLAGTYYYIWSPADMHTITTNPSSPTISNKEGQEIDLSAVYSYTEDVTFTIMADWFIPGAMYQNGMDATASQLITEVKVTF